MDEKEELETLPDQEAGDDISTESDNSETPTVEPEN
jgi:hypothetical protein